MTRERCCSARASPRAIKACRVSSWSRRHARSVNSRKAAGEVAKSPSANSLLLEPLLCAKVLEINSSQVQMQIRPGDDAVLLIIDVQNDFCRGGALAVADGDAVGPVVNRLAERLGHGVLTQD